MSALTVEQLLALHPWPTEFASQPRIEWLWHFEVALSLEQLWPIISDSSRMNRALGVQEMKFEDRGNERWGTSSPLGLDQEWLEVPWNWVTGQWLESLRVYKRGFSKAVWGVFVLTPLEAKKTRVSVYFGAVPRNWFGKLINTLGFPTLEKDFVRVFKEVTAQLDALKPVFELPPPEGMTAAQEARMAQIREKLVTGHDLDVALIDKLLEWIRTGDEVDLFRIQIRERARVWNVNELELLRVALHATREGLLDITWDLICPHCRGPTDKVDSLGELASKGRCEVCEVDFGSNTPESVEITFHVHPAVREIAVRTFCSAEPAKKEHIRLQRDLKPGESYEVSPKLGSGRWRLRTHGSTAYGSLDTGAGASGAIKSADESAGAIKSADESAGALASRWHFCDRHESTRRRE